MMIAGTTVIAIAISAAEGLTAGEQREIVIGVLCDRTGPTQIIGRQHVSGIPRLYEFG
jgi:hypothetical protein